MLSHRAGCLYFLAIGLAFMFMEIAFIQKFVLFLAHPSVCGGSRAMRIPGFRRCWKLAGRAMAEYRRSAQQLPAGGYKRHGSHRPNLSRDPATDFQALIHLPDTAKIAISIALIAPLAICMGMPFPTGTMRLANVAQDSIPWAWAINGFASVVGAVLATLLAIHLGFAVVIILAVLIYGLAAIALRSFGGFA